jgi:hypothetical protein
MWTPNDLARNLGTFVAWQWLSAGRPSVQRKLPHHLETLRDTDRKLPVVGLGTEVVATHRPVGASRRTHGRVVALVGHDLKHTTQTVAGQKREVAVFSVNMYDDVAAPRQRRILDLQQPWPIAGPRSPRLPELTATAFRRSYAPC